MSKICPKITRRLMGLVMTTLCMPQKGMPLGIAMLRPSRIGVFLFVEFEPCARFHKKCATRKKRRKKYESYL